MCYSELALTSVGGGRHDQQHVEKSHLRNSAETKDGAALDIAHLEEMKNESNATEPQAELHISLTPSHSNCS